MRIFWRAWDILTLSSVVTIIVWQPNSSENILNIIGVAVALIALAAGIKAVNWSAGKSDQKLTFDQQLREVLIENVRRTWIDGVLKDALRDAQFDIALKTAPKQAGASAEYAGYKIPQPKTPPQPARGVLQNLMRLVRLGEQQSPQTIPNNPETIVQVFHDVGGKLLILGEPGSGKSVLLLQLAEKLLDEAAQRDSWPLPVVLNLSVWAVERKPIDEWIIEELQRPAYELKKKQVAAMVANKRLIFLLDGLDEVAEAHRLECLEKVNIFMAAGQQVALCSRTAEYEALKAKLATHNAIEMQPLTPAEAESYLNRHIPLETVTAILNMLKQDDEVWQEARKPVFLNILIATYHNRDSVAVTARLQPGQTMREQVQRLIIKPYVERQLQAAPIDSTICPYPRDETEGYLKWLGWHMQGHEQTTFYVEELQRDWLPQHKRLYHILLFLVPGIAAGLAFGVVSGIVVSLVLWRMREIDPIRLTVKVKRQFDFEDARGEMARVLHRGLRRGLRDGLLTALVAGLAMWLESKTVLGLITGVVLGFVFIFTIWVVMGILGGMVGGIIMALTDASLPSQRSQINQGLWDMLGFGLFFGLVLVLHPASNLKRDIISKNGNCRDDQTVQIT